MHQGMNQEVAQGQKMAQRRMPRRGTRVRARKRPFRLPDP
ncbi:hypothetical protein ID866_10972 [Astraeus odoratus]|nr:hypothetical protein ID866_10972 [Astraeus odoratus]